MPTIKSLLIGLMTVALTGPESEGAMPVKPTQTWSGSVGDTTLEAAKPKDGERFGEFVIRVGVVKETTAGLNFHDNLSADVGN